MIHGASNDGTSVSGLADSFGQKRFPVRSARVLLLTGQVDEPSEYVPVMNAIFAASQLRVVLDAAYFQMHGMFYFS